MNNSTANTSDAILPPALVLVAASLAVGSKIARTQFRNLYKSAAPDIAADLDRHVAAARDMEWLDGDEVTEVGRATVERQFSSSMTLQAFSAQKLIRLFASARILKVQVSASSAKLLGNPRVVLPGLVTRAVLGGEIPSIGKSLPATLEVYSRAIATQKVREAFPGITIDCELPPPKGEEPIVAAIFRRAMGVPPESGIEQAFLLGFQTEFNVLVSGSPTTWWSPILAAAARAKMRNTQDSETLAADFVATLQDATRVAAAEATSGWLPISTAFDRFRVASRMSLSDFKRQIVEAALDGQVELSPLNVSSSLPSQLREQSATEFGGRTYHFLRIIKRRSAA